MRELLSETKTNLDGITFIVLSLNDAQFARFLTCSQMSPHLKTLFICQKTYNVKTIDSIQG